LLVLMLNYNHFFAHHGYSTRADVQIDRMTELVQGYANWSFTTGIFAIFAASCLVYRRRLGYNMLEHAVLAVYCQILVIVANLLNLLPTLVWNTPDFIASYKAASQYYMYAVKVLIIALAFKQFFLVDTRREWPRLVAALLVYLAISWLLLRLFAYTILFLVRHQVS
ncbi:MAG TPA: hypothetical protein VET30_06520, partial [Pseudoxanthomonas sp.]|nr:hypothetical protein [Pseudoxanthomonas sp.]